jgi:hypothetical protein
MIIKQQLREKKIPKGGNHNPYIKEEQTKYKRTNNKLFAEGKAHVWHKQKY